MSGVELLVALRLGPEPRRVGQDRGVGELGLDGVVLVVEA